MEVKNYPLYKVLECGTVIGARGKPLKVDKNSTGYHRVSLCRDGIVRRVFVHRLVAEHYVQGYRDGLVVNHKDGDNTNNHYTNLEWVSHSRNVVDGWERGRDKSHLHLNFGRDKA